MRVVCFVCGVSGVGKSTLGRRLARRWGFAFVEGDEFHPHQNITKMRRGLPLEDADRWPWLEKICKEVSSESVVACSALTRSYRDFLRKSLPNFPVRFLLLHGSKDVLSERMAGREGHFMPPELLASQLEALELPSADEPDVQVLDANLLLEELVELAEE